MTDPSHPEMRFFGKVGALYLFDIHYDERERAHCNPLPDGRVLFRLHTQPGFAAATLVYNDGAVRSAALTRYAADARYHYWEVSITPKQPLVRYSFAFKRDDEAQTTCYLGRNGVTHLVETQFTLDLGRAQPFETPAWMHGAVVYQIFPDRFARGASGGAPADDTLPWGEPPHARRFQGGDLPGICDRLDYLQELGVEVLYLNPIFTASSNHRYDVSDFYHVDPRLGGNEALRRLVGQAHERGMRVILDASFNHCSPGFFAFRDLLENGASSRYRDWFFARELPPRIYIRPQMIPPAMRDEPHVKSFWDHVRDLEANSGIPVVTAEGFGPPLETSYTCWNGMAQLPKLNQENPETRAYFLDVATYWLRELDIDGWRMDVVSFVPDEFWRAFRRACKAVKPGCYLVAEVWGDSTPWLRGDMFDATMNYLFRELCRGYFATGALSTEALLEGLHRLLARYPAQAAAVSYSLLSSHDVPRFLHECEGDGRRLRLATLFQMTMPGAPSLYYGDEIGVTGGGDPDNRRTFPWEDRARWDMDMHRLVRSLIQLRRATGALRHGSFRLVWRGPEGFAFMREHDGERVLVVIHRGDQHTTIEIDLGPRNDRLRAELVWGECHVVAQGARVTLSQVPAWSGCCVLLAAEV